MRYPCLLLLLLLQQGLPASAASRPELVALCQEDEDNAPWVSASGPSYTGYLLERAMTRLKQAYVVHYKPWKRCLMEMQSNAEDGVINASFLPERLSMGRYPMRGEQADVSRRTLVASYSLYRPFGGKISWDGKKFTNAGGTVGIQTNFSIGKQLRQAGLTVDDSNRRPEDLLRHLMLGSYVAIAMHTATADHFLRTHPEYGSVVEKLPIPLVEKPYYLMLSHQFVKRYPEFAEQLWDEIAKVRDSPEFERQVAPLLGKH